MPGQLQLRDGVAVDLVRAVGETQLARVGVIVGEHEVVGDAGRASIVSNQRSTFGKRASAAPWFFQDRVHG